MIFSYFKLFYAEVYSEKSWNQTAGFSFSLLESVGFNMSGWESDHSMQEKIIIHK